MTEVDPVNTTETGEPLGEGPVDTLAVIEHGAARGFWRGADAVLAVKQLAERRGQALGKIRDHVHEALEHPRSHAYHIAVLQKIADLTNEAGA